MSNLVSAWANPLDRTDDSAFHPSGNVDLTELSDLELDAAGNGAKTGLVGTLGCCWCVPWYSSWTKCGLLCDHPGCS
jgi:hypothetical protein